MTIDEFMRDIAPKMREGWVAMDRDEIWYYLVDKPKLNKDLEMWLATKRTGGMLLESFDIVPVDDWTQSLRKVGGNGNTLKLVLTDHWFEEIKSGRKTHEYRQIKKFWLSRLHIVPLQSYDYSSIKEIARLGNTFLGWDFVEFQKAYRKNPERITFKIKKIVVVDGKNTDLHIDDLVFDIELGERVK